MSDFIEGFQVGFRSRLAFRAGLVFHLGWKLGRRVKAVLA